MQHDRRHRRARPSVLVRVPRRAPAPTMVPHPPDARGRLGRPGRGRPGPGRDAGSSGGRIDRGPPVLVAGGDPRRGRGHHRVPADLLDRPPAGGLPAAGPARRRGQRGARGGQHLRHRDPVRRHPGGARPVLGPVPGHAPRPRRPEPGGPTPALHPRHRLPPVGSAGRRVGLEDRGRPVRSVAGGDRVGGGRRTDPGVGGDRAHTRPGRGRPGGRTTAWRRSPTARP